MPAAKLEFDYVIVGAGPSAMGIVYALLENYKNGDTPPFSIAVVERGDRPPHSEPIIKQPHRWYEAAHNTHKNSTVELYTSQITSRRMDAPVGKGLGGSSNVNACLCIPPLQRDLESWPEPWKSSLLPAATYVKRILKENGVLHEWQNGWEDTTQNVSWYKNVTTLVKVDKKTGQFIRSDYYSGLVEPVLSKYCHLQKCLHWFCGVQAERLLFDDNQIVGVECRRVGNHMAHDRYFSVNATRRTILCAGAIESPALLLVSGIGNNPHFDGIGKNLKDQALLAKADLTMPLSLPQWRSKLFKRHDLSTSGVAGLGHFISTAHENDANDDVFQVVIADSSCYASILPSIAGSVFCLKCKNSVFSQLFGVLHWVIKSCVQLVFWYTPVGWVVRRFVTVSMLCLMHPQSSGEVTIHAKGSGKKMTASDLNRQKLLLRRSDIEVNVDPGYLNKNSDRKDFRDAWDAALKSAPVTSSSLVSLEVFPKPLKLLCRLLIASDDAWFWIFCQCFLHPYFHFAGTCAMPKDVTSKSENKGDKQHWVVDSTLKLQGHRGLYICDASVFPSMISNPPALTCAALGYQFSTTILKEDDMLQKPG